MGTLAILAVIVAAAMIGWLMAIARTRASMESTLRGAEALAAAASAEAAALRTELESARRDCESLRTNLEHANIDRVAHETRADEMRRRLEEQRQLVADVDRKFTDTFRALSAEALRSSSESFLTLATERLSALQQQSAAELDVRRNAIDQTVAPVRETLSMLDRELRRIENERRGAADVLTEQLRSLSTQTNRLVDALKTPIVRGRWGEIQLRRVVEIAGMVEHCDFHEQAHLATEEGRLRPDMTIRLPGDKTIVLDAKVPLLAYMEAIEAEGESERATKLRDHARQIRNHIEQLSAKSYWDALGRTPEFVILFLPGEMFFSAALQQDPRLIEDGAARRVILATPTTLIALLKAVAYGWRQEHLAENAERISRIGQELYDRIVTMRDHLAKVGSSLGGAVRSFNDAVGSLQARVIPSARRLRELGVGGKNDLKDLEPVDNAARELGFATENGIEEAPGK